MHSLADGSSTSNPRADAATVRIMDSYMRVCRTAERLLVEFERTSASGSGVIRLPMDERDSTPTR